MSKFRLNCPCGDVFTADDESSMILLARAHLAAEHPALVEAYSDQDILTASTVVPVWKKESSRE